MKWLVKQEKVNKNKTKPLIGNISNYNIIENKKKKEI